MRKQKTTLAKAASVAAPLARTIAALTANSACYFYSYQPKVPEKLKKND